MSSTFWYLFDEDILKGISSGGPKNGRGVRKERIDEGGGNGNLGRVSALAVLNHHIGMTGQGKYPPDPALLANQGALRCSNVEGDSTQHNGKRKREPRYSY